MSIQKAVQRTMAVLVIVLVSLCWKSGDSPVLAQEPAQENELCFTCHTNPDLAIEFPDGTSLNAHVSRETYNNSVHGQEGMTCGGCHPDHRDYPHAEVKDPHSRTYTLALNETCLECHPDQAERVQDSIHTRFFNEGKTETAVCVDCHGAHGTVSLSKARIDIAVTCRKCHSDIYDEYSQSAHYKALVEEGNTDVPTCVDCHGVHSIEDPTTARFRLMSPNLCGGCHADKELMGKYDVSTDVFETYVADFHGSTVTLFEKQSPDAPTNKAVCYDCHGAHAIRAVDDPESSVIKENLLVTCQKCHPDATANFPDSWTSHYQPTFDKQPLVSAVNWFYRIVIPATIGFMGLYVVIDGSRRIRNKFRKK